MQRVLRNGQLLIGNILRVLLVGLLLASGGLAEALPGWAASDEAQAMACKPPALFVHHS